MADFHAAKEISSDLMAGLLSCAVVMSPVKKVYYINLVLKLQTGEILI
jgi:hypothetical protein